jgi:hypothetical protein
MRLFCSGFAALLTGVFFSHAAELSLDQSLPGSAWTFPAAKADADKAKIQFLKNGQLKLGWNPAPPASTFHWKMISPDTVELHTEIDQRKISTLKIDSDFLEATLTADGGTYFANNVTAPAAANLVALMSPKSLSKQGSAWTLKNGELSSPAKTNGFVALEGEFPRENFMIRLRVSNPVPRSPLMVSVPVKNKQMLLIIDHKEPNGIKGLDTATFVFLHKKPGWHDEPEAVHGKLVTEGSAHKLEIAVRSGDETCEVATWLDGKPSFHWSGPVSSLRTGWNLGKDHADQMGLETHDAGWVISSVRVTPLTPEENKAMDAMLESAPPAEKKNEKAPQAAVPANANKNPNLPAWVSTEMPVPGPSGWITLFDGKKLYDFNPNFASKMRSGPDHDFSLKSDGLHLHNNNLHFVTANQNVILRVHVIASANCYLGLRANTDPDRERARGYRTYMGAHPDQETKFMLVDDDSGSGKELKTFAGKRFSSSPVEYEMAATGTKLSFKINGISVAEVLDSTFNEGDAVFGCSYPTTIKRIEVRILDTKK